MMSMAQPYSPHPAGLQQHPGMAQGHPMAGGHPQQGGQPGPGMPQMHMGVSGPGGSQVSQAGAMLGVMPPGAVGPSAHALQHLNPNQAQMFQQQQQAQQAQMAFANPQMQQMQQHQHLIQQQQQQRNAQAQRQAMMAQQYNSGMPMNMPNGMHPQMSQAQFAAMRGGVNPNMRPVALPQHLQQQQQQAQLGLEQQQAQQHAQQQQQVQQQLLAQQMMQVNAAAAQAGPNQSQPNQIPQQLQNIQNAQLAAAQQHQQQQQQAQQAASQQSPAQPQAQAQAQQGQQPQAQAQPQQPQAMPQQQQVPGAAMMPRGDQMKGHCILKLVQFGDHLSQFNVSSKPIDMYMSGDTQFLDAQAKKQQDDLNYWSDFVETFFAKNGVLRHSVWIVDEQSSTKQYEITFPALARYFHTHFESGIQNMQLIAEKAKEKPLPLNCHYVESPKSSFIYWFDNGSQLVANGTLRAQFDAFQKIELLEFVTSNHEEYVPRTKIVEAARPLHEWQKEWQKINAPPDGKQSPEMSKKAKARPMKSPPNAPPEIDFPESKVKATMGITPSVFRFLELAEVMGQMNPLFNYSHVNSNLAPYAALDSYVSNIPPSNAGGAAGNPNGVMPPGQRTPSMGQFPLGQSPAAAHLNLPDNNSMIGGSPAQGHMQAPGMALQQSQQGTSSSGPSANTSPNVSNKRRRASVKAESEEGAGQQPNGVQNKVKPSPRMGKRQKGANQS